MRLLFVSMCLANLLVACSNVVTQEEFDSKTWKSDRYGCEGRRVELLKSLENIKPKLKGLNEVEIREVLGKPDFSELYNRNQKFYTYYIDASPKCDTPTDGQARLVQIRFDAINRVNEIVVIMQ